MSRRHPQLPGQVNDEDTAYALTSQAVQVYLRSQME